MNDVLAFVVCAALGAMLLPRAVRDELPALRGLAGFSLAAHLLASLAQVWITEGVYGGGDMLAYFRTGLVFSRLLRYDLGTFGPEVLNVLLQREALLPVPVATGSPTSTMMGIAGFLLFALFDSLYGCVAAIAVVAFFGKLALYRALARDAEASLRKPLFIGVMLLPSVVFWSCGLLKESLIIGPLGFLYAAFRDLVVERRVAGVAALGAAAFVIGLLKPYVLFAFIAGAGAYLYGDSARRAGRAATIRPVPLALTAALAIGGVIGLGEIFPEFALDHVAEAAAAEQAMGQRMRGGSAYTIGDPTARTISGQLAFAPIAIASSLFRPFLFEARNAQSLVSALEMTALLVLTARALSRRRWSAMWQDIIGSPMLMFCIVFTLTFALPVGLATTNLGTLTRYRMPLLPFFGAALMIWNTDLFRRGGERWHARS